MTDQNQPLPPFEIVSIEDASTNLAKRLRVYVAIRVEDMDQLNEVAADVIDGHAGNNDVVMMFFHATSAAAGRAPAEGRAQYIRNGMKQGYAPKPMTSDLGGYDVKTRVKTPRGVIVVETARQAG